MALLTQRRIGIRNSLAKRSGKVSKRNGLSLCLIAAASMVFMRRWPQSRKPAVQASIRSLRKRNCYGAFRQQQISGQCQRRWPPGRNPCHRRQVYAACEHLAAAAQRTVIRQDGRLQAFTPFRLSRCRSSSRLRAWRGDLRPLALRACSLPQAGGSGEWRPLQGLGAARQSGADKTPSFWQR